MAQDRLLNRILVYLLIVAVALYLIEKLGNVATALSGLILLLALSWLLAYTLQPIVNWLHRGVVPERFGAWVRKQGHPHIANLFLRMRLPYGLAVTIVYLLILALLFYFILTLIPIVIEQVNQLVQNLRQVGTTLPGSIQRIQEWLNNLADTLRDEYHIDPSQIGLPQDLLGQLTTALSGLGQFALQLATGIINFLGQLLLVFLFSALIMAEGHRTTKETLHLLPDRVTRSVRLFAGMIDRSFGGFLRGTLLQALIYGTVVSLLMAIFGLQYAVAVGFATGLLMIIPFIGGLIGLLLPLIIGLLQSSPNTWLLIVLLFAFQIILFNIVMPRILSHSLRMPTLLVFISLIIGTQFLGIWGLVFAVPMAGALYAAMLEVLHRAKYNNSVESPHPHDDSHA